MSDKINELKSSCDQLIDVISNVSTTSLSNDFKNTANLMVKIILYYYYYYFILTNIYLFY
jgi:hypothetical protein